MAYVIAIENSDHYGVFGPFRRRATAERKAESMRRLITRTEREERPTDPEMAEWWARLDVYVAPLWPGGLSRGNMVSALCGGFAESD